MSNLENQVKTLITPMINGESKVLNKEQQLTIATWIALRFVIWEYTDPRTMAISLEERNVIYTQLKPPSNWVIYIGKYEGESENNIRVRHDAHLITDTNKYNDSIGSEI